MKNSERKLTDWINGYLEYTANSEAPYLYRKWTAISCVASALQRKCMLQWGTGIVWYPNMYIVLVGPSAARKGTAMGPGLDILQSVGTIKIAANSTSLQALIKRLKETNHNDPDLETGEMIFHASMTVFSKEFTVFLGYQNNAMISALCDWYDCDKRWSYETISRQTEEIVGVWVNLIGATTPDLIRLCMPIEMIGGGLTSRIIYVVADKKAKSEPYPQTTVDEEEMKIHLIHDLEKIALLAGKFKYSEAFLSAWGDWYVDNDQKPPDLGKHFQGYLGRRATHVMKLAMISSASRHGTMHLELKDLYNAIDTITEVEQTMPGVFKGVGKNPYADVMQQSITWLCTLNKPEVTVQEFYLRYQDDLDRFSLDRLIQSLEIIGKVKRKHGTGGSGDSLLILPT